MRGKKLNFYRNQIFEAIYVCSAVIGCMVIVSRPIIGVMLLLVAIFTRIENCWNSN